MQEVRHDGIRVACVAPGSVDTTFGGGGRDKSRLGAAAGRRGAGHRAICSATRRAACRAASRCVRRSRRERADPCPSFDKHREQLELHETMMGASRGRLAVALDLLTDALAMVGQHGVYCQSARTPGRPTLDIALRHRADWRREGAAADRDRVPTARERARPHRRRRALQPARAARAVGPRRSVPRARHPARAHRRPAAAARRLHDRRRLARRARRAGARDDGAVASQRHHAVRRRRARGSRLSGLRVPARASRCAPRWPDGRSTCSARSRPAIQIADAIADAHANGFVHGGLSPESVAMTQRGHAKIPAFELAAHGGFDRGRRTGAKCGCSTTCRPRRPAGSRPTIGPTSTRWARSSTRCSPRSGRTRKGAAAPSASNRHVPPELDDVVLRAVAPNPTSRPQSAAALRRRAAGRRGAHRRAGRRRRRSRRSARAVDEPRARAAVCRCPAGGGRPGLVVLADERAASEGLGFAASRAEDRAEPLDERRARQHLIDAGRARRRDDVGVDVRHEARASGRLAAPGRPSSRRSPPSAASSRCRGRR